MLQNKRVYSILWFVVGICVIGFLPFMSWQEDRREALEQERLAMIEAEVAGKKENQELINAIMNQKVFELSEEDQERLNNMEHFYCTFNMIVGNSIKSADCADVIEHFNCGNPKATVEEQERKINEDTGEIIEDFREPRSLELQEELQQIVLDNYCSPSNHANSTVQAEYVQHQITAPPEVLQQGKTIAKAILGIHSNREKYADAEVLTEAVRAVFSADIPSYVQSYQAFHQTYEAAQFQIQQTNLLNYSSDVLSVRYSGVVNLKPTGQKMQKQGFELTLMLDTKTEKVKSSRLLYK